MIDDNLTIAC